MVLLHLRVFFKFEDLPKIYQFVKNNCESYLVVQEGDDINAVDPETRPHIHSILAYNLTLSSFRRLFHEATANVYVGNKAYGLALAKEPDSLKNYICKGEKTIPPRVLIKSSDYTNELVQQYHTAYWAHPAQATIQKKTMRNFYTMFQH